MRLSSDVVSIGSWDTEDAYSCTVEALGSTEVVAQTTVFTLKVCNQNFAFSTVVDVVNPRLLITWSSN